MLEPDGPRMTDESRRGEADQGREPREAPTVLGSILRIVALALLVGGVVLLGALATGGLTGEEAPPSLESLERAETHGPMIELAFAIGAGGLALVALVKLRRRPTFPSKEA